MVLTENQMGERLRSNENMINILSSIPAASPEVEDKGEVDSSSDPSKELSPSPENSTTVIKWAGNSTKEREHYRLTHEQRVTIGSLGKTFKPKDVAALTGVSVHAVRDLRNGKKGSSGYSADLAADIEKVASMRKKEVQSEAVDRLLQALGFIDHDKLANMNGKDLASTAANLSKVAANMEPRDKNGDKPMVNIIIHQPKPLKEQHFETVEV